MAGKRRSIEQRLVDERRRLTLVRLFENVYKSDPKIFSEAVGKPWNHLRQLLKERDKGGHAMGEESARHLEDALDLPPGYFLNPTGAPPKDIEDKLLDFELRLKREELALLAEEHVGYKRDDDMMSWTEAARRYGPRPIASRVPLVGTAPGNLPSGVWCGDVLVAKPFGFVELCTKDKMAFLVQVSDAAMAPRFHIGELAFIEPSMDVEIEDDVLVYTKTGDFLLRRLLARRTAVKLGTYDGSSSSTLDPAEVQWIYLAAYPLPGRLLKPLR